MLVRTAAMWLAIFSSVVLAHPTAITNIGAKAASYPIRSRYHDDTIDFADLDDPLAAMTDPAYDVVRQPKVRAPKTEASIKTAEVRKRRQLTRAQIVARDDLKKKRKKTATKARAVPPTNQPSAAAGSVATITAYSLQARDLPFYAGQGYQDVSLGGLLGALLGGYKVVKTVGACYDQCRRNSFCDGFTWYSMASPSTGDGHCYLLNVSGFGSSWRALSEVTAPPSESGTYFINGGTCTKNDWNAPSSLKCAVTRPFTGFNTCTSAQTTLNIPGASYFPNWQSSNNNIYSRRMTDPLQCRDYCRSTAGCFGFVWAPAESKCWLKTGDKARYVKTNWSYNDIHSKGSDGGLYMLDTSCDSLTGYNPPGAPMTACCNITK